MLRAEAEFRIAKELTKISNIFKEYIKSNGFEETDMHCHVYENGEISLWAFSPYMKEDVKYILNYYSEPIKKSDGNIHEYIKKIAESEVQQ